MNLEVPQFRLLIFAVATALLPSDVLIADTPDAELSVDVLIQHLAADSVTKRCEAIVALEAMGADATAAAPRLVDCLAEDHEGTAGGRTTRVSDFAEHALETIGKPALSSLIEGLKHQRIPVRRRSADLLGVIKGDAAVAPLVKALDSAHRSVATAASVALSRIGEPAVERLAKLLQETIAMSAAATDIRTNVQIRPVQPAVFAINALGQIDDERVYEPIMQAVESPVPKFRQAAAQALYRMSVRRDGRVSVLSKGDFVRRLIPLIRSDDNRIATTVMGLLRRVTGQGVDVLIDELDNPDPRVRLATFQSCKNLRDDPRVTTAAITCLNGTGPLADTSTSDERVGAIRYLRSLAVSAGKWPEGAVDAILRYLGDEDAMTQTEALNAFTDFGRYASWDSRIVSEIVKQIQREPEHWSTPLFVQALGTSGNPAAVKPLTELLANCPPIARPAAEDVEQVVRVQARGILNQKQRVAIQICEALAAIGDRSAIPALRERISFDEPHVMEALGTLGDRDSVPDQVRNLLSKEIGLQNAAAHALTHTSDSRAIGPLSRMLQREITRIQGRGDTDSMKSVRRTFAHRLASALAATMDRRAATELVNSVWLGSIRQGAPTHNFRSFASRAQRDPRSSAIASMGIVAVPALLKELQSFRADDVPKNTQSEWAQRIIVWSLTQIVSSNELTETESPIVERALLNRIDELSSVSQQFVIQAFGHMKSKNAIPVLQRLLHQIDKDARASDAEYRQAGILSSLASIDSAVAMKELPIFLAHDAALLRKTAVAAAAKAKSPDVVLQLIPMLADSDRSVRETLARQLGILGDLRAVVPLCESLATTDDDSSVKFISNVLQSLGMLNDRSVADRIHTYATHASLQVRTSAAWSLIQLHDDRGVETLRDLLSYPDGNDRGVVTGHAELLTDDASHGNGAPLSFLPGVNLLADAVANERSEHVRISAARALAGCPQPSAVECLVHACNVPSPRVQAAALNSLLKMDSEVGARALENMAGDSAALCRIAAAFNFANVHKAGPWRSLTVDESADALAKLLTDNDLSVRTAATKSLVKLQQISPKSVTPSIELLRQLATDDQWGVVRYFARLVVTKHDSSAVDVQQE